MLSSLYHRYGGWLLAAVALTFPLLWYQANSIPSNNDIETWLPRDTDIRRTYEHFKLDFGGEEVIVVGVATSLAGPELVEAITARIERLPGIRVCWSPARMVARMAEFGVDEETARKRLDGFLLSASGEHAGLVALMTAHGLAHREETVDQVRQVLSYCGLQEHQVALTGAPVIVTELDRLGSQKANRKFFTITILLSMGLLYFSFRHWGMTLSILGVTLWGIFLNQSILYWCGGEMNFILGSLSVMVMIFTLSISIHFVSYYVEAVEEKAADPLWQALKSSWWPCFLSTLTTLLGLISLNVSSIVPVSQFGYACATGSVVALVVALGITPAILVIWPDCTVKSMKVHIDFEQWGGWVARYRGRIIGAMVMLLSVAAYGLTFLKPDVDPSEFLPRDSKIVTDLHTIERDLTSIDSVEAIVDLRGQELAFLDQLAKVREIEAIISGHPAVRHTLSLGTFFPDDMPDGAFAAARLLSKAQSYSGDEGLVACQQQLWRVSARIRQDRGHSPIEVFEDLQQSLVGQPVTLTGLAPLLKSAQQEIFAGFWKSFAAACLTISVVMVLSLRSLLAGMIAMIPNIIPIWLVFGFVGYLGVPVDIGMMMTGSIALGISVDCTFHFLVHYQQAYRQGESSIEACRKALAHCGEPMLDSTIISSVGMLALCLSSFTPTSRFGMLMGAQMVASLLGELVILPALLCCRPSRQPAKVPVSEPTPPPVDESEGDGTSEPQIHSLPIWAARRASDRRLATS